jgi:hypothetical protein
LRSEESLICWVRVILSLDFFSISRVRSFTQRPEATFG